MLRTLSLALLAFAFMLSPVHAVEINDEGKKRLRAIFSGLIEDQKNVFNSKEKQLLTEGEIIIEQADDYYSVTLPKLTYTSQNQQKIEIGFISVNAVPTDKPEDWKMSVTFPSKIDVIGKDGQKSSEITLGKQKMQGVWNTNLNSFAKFKAQYDDIIITDTKNSARGIIEEIEMMGDSKENDGKWSGPSRFTLENLKMEKDGKTHLTIKDINTDVQLVNYDPKNRKIMLQKIEEANAQNKEIDLSEVMKLYGSNYAMEMSINKITGDIPTSKKRPKPVKFSMDEASFKMKSESNKDQKVNYDLQFGYEGLKANDLDKYAPSQFNLDLSLANLPVKEIREMASGMNISRDNPNSAKVAALQGMMTLPQILSKAGTTLKIDDTGFSNDNYEVGMNGDFKATPQSPLGVIGDIKLKIEGLDKIVKDLEKQKESAEPDTVTKINSTLKNIQAIQLFAEKKGDIDLLHFTMGEEGKVLINGKDISLLMGQR